MNLNALFLKNNPIKYFPENIFSDLTKLYGIDIRGTQLIFKPNNLPLGWTIYVDPDVVTEEEAFRTGNTILLDFNLNDEIIPGTITEKGLLKLEIMLKSANQKIKNDPEFALKNSSTLNQLFYHASILSQEDAGNKAIQEQAETLLKAYLDTPPIKQFAEQANALTFDASKYEGFIFVTENGEEGLTVLKPCYEVNVLNAPFANKNASNTSLMGGILVHKINQELPQTLDTPEQIRPFALLHQAYQRTVNQQGVDTFLSSINIGEEYKNRFTEALTASSVGILARNRGMTPGEKADVMSYKMVDGVDQKKLFKLFSKVVKGGAEGLGQRDAMITDEHAESIYKAFPGFVTKAERAALMFTLSSLFVKYSSEPFFGTSGDSPAALRFYASALLNKLRELDQKLFTQIQNFQDQLFKDACTDTLSSDMKVFARKNPALFPIYEQVMPQMWQ